MRKILVADCETDPFKRDRIPKPFIWGLYDGEVFLKFNKTADFMRHLSSLEPCIIYAHNGGKFDWHFILDYLEPFSEISIISGRLAKFKINEVEFRDSYNILPVPLSAYQKDDIDYGIFEAEERIKPKNMDLIVKYLESDCVYLYEIVKGFIEEYGLNLTLAGAAMKTWRKLKGAQDEETDEFFYNHFKPFYYGGRVECFKTGIIDKPFKVIDVNSAYPFAMTFDHAAGDEFYNSRELPDKIQELRKSFIHCIAKSNGVFPFRDQTGLKFPNDGDYREFFITGWEFEAAESIGKLDVKKILDVYTFERNINFTSYVNHFFQMKAEAKREGNKKNYLFAKLMQNSLYGKYAANPTKYHEFMIVDPKFIEASFNDGWEFNGLLADWGLLQRPLDESKRRYYNIAIAASITGFQRASLMKALDAVKEPLYCDTDSITCLDTGKLAISPRLGDWEVEADCTGGAIAGKKLYAFKTKNGYKIASKGVRLNADQIYRIAKGEEIVYESETPTFSIKKEPHFIDRKISLTFDR